MNDEIKPYKPTFVVVSAVKKLVHGKGRRCSPEFVEALDVAVNALVRKACDSHNGGAKTLDASVLSDGVTVKAPEPKGIRAAFDEVVCLGLQMNVQTKGEFQQRVARVKSHLEPFLARG